MSVKRGLGKGLGALIPDAAGRDAPLEVDVRAIRPNPSQPRRDVGDEGLRELTASIREHGLIQPLVLRHKGTGYEIVAGERRWRAAQEAGLSKVPAVVREIGDESLLEVALVENLQREDLNALDEALALRELLRIDSSQERVAGKIGKSRPYVANALRLLDLEAEVQNLLRAGRLGASHARTLLGLSGASQVAAARDVVTAELTVRETEQLVKRKNSAPAPASRKRAPGHPEFESVLGERLAAKVQISARGPSGKIVISYHGEDDLNRILDLLLEDEP